MELEPPAELPEPRAAAAKGAPRNGECVSGARGRARCGAAGRGVGGEREERAGPAVPRGREAVRGAVSRCGPGSGPAAAGGDAGSGGGTTKAAAALPPPPSPPAAPPGPALCAPGAAPALSAAGGNPRGGGAALRGAVVPRAAPGAAPAPPLPAFRAALRALQAPFGPFYTSSMQLPHLHLNVPANFYGLRLHFTILRPFSLQRILSNKRGSLSGSAAFAACERCPDAEMGNAVTTHECPSGL